MIHRHISAQDELDHHLLRRSTWESVPEEGVAWADMGIQSVRRRPLGSVLGLSQLRLDWVTIEPGAETPFVSCLSGDEIIIVTDGAGFIHHQDTATILARGGYAAFPALCPPRALSNLSNQPWSFLHIRPAGISSWFFPGYPPRLLLELPDGPHWFTGIDDIALSGRGLIKRSYEIDALTGSLMQHQADPSAHRLERSLNPGFSSLGCRFSESQPGHPTTAFHRHYATEEYVFITGGVGKARIGDLSFGLETGDLMGFPLRSKPHTMWHETGQAALRYFMGGIHTEVLDAVDYPDQNTSMLLVGGRRFGMDGLVTGLAEVRKTKLG